MLTCPISHKLIIDFVPRPTSLHAFGLLRRSAITANQSEGGRPHSLARSHLSCVIFRGGWQVLIYLFRDEGTGNRALTMDVTGRLH